MDTRNILVVLCDQLRPDFLSMYGCEAIPTPNLDRLAQQGVVFEQAITQSTVCAPARASMMTGRYVTDHGVWTNDVPFRDGLEYLPERMNELGYATAAFGKLHHFPGNDAKGFSHVRQMEEGRLKEREPYLQWLQTQRPGVERIWNHTDHEFDFSEEEYYEHWIASETIDFIQTQQDSAPDVPFLAWVSFQGPHNPYDPPSEVKGTCQADALPQALQRETQLPPVAHYRQVREGVPDSPEEIAAVRLAYAESIVAIDRQIGRILEELEAGNLTERTTIIFSADHGDLLWDFGLTAKGPFPYRGQLEIPLLVANHPAIQPGTRTSNLAGNIDIPGTVLDIAGAERGIGMSRSLLDLAQHTPKHPREVNFCEFCDSTKIVENQRYRYCYYPFSDAELFDKETDPDELKNLAGRPELAAVEVALLKHLVDFGILVKGLRVEAHDFVPEQQAGVEKKHPAYQDDFPVACPPTAQENARLRAAGLSTDFCDFCRKKKIVTAYHPAYWEEKS